MVRWLKRVVLTLLLAGVVAGSVVAVRGGPIVVETVAAQRAPLRELVTAEGTTRLKDRRVVVAPLGGHLERIPLKVGDAVRVGQVVARIRPIEPALLDSRTRSELQAKISAAEAAEGESQAAVERARLAKEHAERQLERTRKLTASDSIAAVSLDDAELSARLRTAEVTSARAALDSARANTAALRALARRGRGKDTGGVVEVAAPVSGRVLRVHMPDPSPVEAGVRLLELGDLRALEIVADLLTSDALKMRQGTPAEVGDFGSGEALRGSVRLVEPSAFTKVSSLGIQEQRVNVIIDLLETADPRLEAKEESQLGDGFRVMARLVTWKSNDVLQVPTTALFRDAARWYLMAVTDGRVSRRAVTTGHRNEESTEILAGVELGTPVVRYLDNRLYEGVRVVPETRP